MSLNSRAIFSSSIVLNNVTVINNSKGGVMILSSNINMILNVMSSHFIENNNGALMIDIGRYNLLNFNKVSFLRNRGASDSQGIALHLKVVDNTVINLFDCKFDHNIATGRGSIAYIYIAVEIPNSETRLNVTVLMHSASFVNNELGSALYISQIDIELCNFTLFQNNSARFGAAIYVDKNAQITVCDESLVQFINNTATLRGGAIYTDLSNCFTNRILFSNLTNFSSLVFINNTAKVSGNSIYFNVPESCNIERNYTQNNSVAYIPYKLKYIQSHDTLGPAIAASPYRLNLCSPHECSVIRDECLITEKMLGQLVFFNGTVCDYFDAVAETVQFQIQCINCDTEFRLFNYELLVNSRSSNKIAILTTNAHDDIVNDSNITLELSSVLSSNYKKVFARLSVTLSTCYNGFVFSTTSQKCDCYNSGSDDIVQCQEDRAEIKRGYWYGIILKKHTTSLCPINYCNFNHRTKTRNNYYTLPKNRDDQCSSHRTGVACSYCKSGYTLSYDSSNCININHCSPGITVLVIVLTFLYWIVIVVMLFGLTYYFGNQVSSGYFNGVIYFYSVVEVLLLENLHIMDGVFYTVAVLSSFAKLTPQFLGRLCIGRGLDAIDQQFIHYSHMVFISFILIGIIITAKFFKRLSFNVNSCIARVVSLFLVLSYTSVTSTSLQLLRGVQYNDIDGVFVYLSPQNKYFTYRHGVYAIVALLSGLTIVIGLPLLLIVEPFLRKKIIIKKLRPILNQFQDGYKDNYKWFAAYYLLCRLVIMLIAYFGNRDYNAMVYYMQTACVIIVMNHAFFWPYKKHLLNVLDAAILLTMLIVVNLHNFDFPKSAAAGLVYTLLIIPLCLLFAISFHKIFMAVKMKFKDINNQNR